jgi:superfamily II DNA helicase RecQ
VGDDVFLLKETGGGKTFCLLAPILLRVMRAGPLGDPMTFVLVVPLVELERQHLSTCKKAAKSFHLSILSDVDHGGTRAIWDWLRGSKWEHHTLLVLRPETLTSIWRGHTIETLNFAITVFDEFHAWEDFISFRLSMAEYSGVRIRLPNTCQLILVSPVATSDVRRIACHRTTRVIGSLKPRSNLQHLVFDFENIDAHVRSLLTAGDFPLLTYVRSHRVLVSVKVDLWHIFIVTCSLAAANG